jgi:hypothetical protein
LMNVDVVVATGTWLLRRSVLISPQAFGDFRQDGDCLIVNLTPSKRQVNSHTQTQR